MTRLRDLALVFLRLGATGFGGPAAHVAMMQAELVKRRQWLSEERFLDLLGATNLIPGPNSTEMAIHIGWERRRWAGLVVAGVAFILPAMVITGAFGWAYVRYGALPAVGWVLYGVKPVILAVVVQAIWSLAPRAAKTTRLQIIAAVAAIVAAAGANEVAVIFGAGAASFALARVDLGKGSDGRLRQLVLPIAASAGASAVSLTALFGVFFKIGSVLFGSGYVLLAFLRADLVERLGWLTEAQLIDAVAVGQVTPGPVFTTATFIGYLLAGPVGALVATVAIFLPAFVFVALSAPVVLKLRASRALAAFLDGVNVASLALMAVVTIQLGHAVLIDVPTVVFALAAAALLIRFEVNATWLVLGGAAAGYAAQALGLAPG